MAGVTDDEIISVFHEAEDPILTAGDVAEAVGVTRQSINSRLHRLNSEGRLETREVGSRARVWWLSDSESEE
jgi:GTP-sensing pleiotropic transcriptional regulator CodY